MADARRALLDELFEAACDLAPAERDALLDTRCGDDTTLRGQVLRLLREDQRAADGFMGGRDDVDEASVGAAPLGQRIGQFRLIRLLGEGGMGTVYEAEQETPRRRVALKLLRAGVHATSLAARFAREADVLARLVHPGIAQIHEVGAAAVGDGRSVPYFAMELVGGLPLDRHVRSQSLRPAQILELVASICDIVQFAHDRGVIHRDLKPANVMVVEGPPGSRGEGEPTTGESSAVVKVLDFGVARATLADETTPIETAPGQMLGTIPYMSPEQLSGDPAQVDGRSDVYALGVVLYELLAGRLPHDVRWNSMPDAVRAIREDDPASLGAANRELRGDIETIVAKAMEKSPERRYQQATDLAADIRRHLRHAPIVARPTSAWQHVRKFSRRHRTLSTATAAFVGVWIVASALILTFYLRAERARERAERRFEIARELGDLVLFDVVEQLGSIPGARAARLGILEQASPFYERLAAERPDEPARRRGIWVSLTTLGQSYGMLGAFGPARDRLAAAEELVLQAIREEPGDVTFQADLAWNTHFRGLTEHRAGNLPEAISQFQLAESLYQSIVDGGSGTEQDTRRLSHVRRRYGDALKDAGDERAAEAVYLGSLAIEERIAAEGSSGDSSRDFDDRLNLSRTWRRLGELARQTGRTEEARAWLSRAVALRETLWSERPNDFNTMHDLSLATEELAMTLLDAQEPAAAVVPAQRSADMAEQLSAREPDAIICRQQRARSWRTLAIALARGGGDEAAARDAARRAVDAARLLAGLTEPSPTDLGVAALVLGTLEPADLRAPTEALSLAARAVEATGGADVQALLTLAIAEDAVGRRDSAMATRRRALDRIPPGATGRRAQIEAMIGGRVDAR